MLTAILFLSFLSLISVNAATIQGTCVRKDRALSNLARRLSKSALIACRGSPGQLHNAGRYWGQQYGKNASVVVYPTTPQEVSYAVKAAANTPLGLDFAFVCGAHGQTNASSAEGFIIDLSWMNSTAIISNATFDALTYEAVVAYDGGATWSQVQAATAGSGWTAVGARVGSVGVGGFSTGGGIGFLAGAHGYAVDRLVAMEVVLMNGRIVNATATNRYSDLFWALQGGGGQFGVVTRFYQKAVPEPASAQIGVYVVAEDSAEQARENTVDFFNNHDDPFSLMYYALGFFPAELSSGPWGLQTILVGLYFGDPQNPQQKSFDETYAGLLSNLTITYNTSYNVPYSHATDVVDPFFPYGFRRGFYGPQIQNITSDYLQTIALNMGGYLQTMIQDQQQPASALWALQYMYPGLNGNLPPSDSATAWPHSISAHQTLFSPAWQSAEVDASVLQANGVFNNITWTAQEQAGPVIADYPNYISPDVPGSRVWGSNVERLIAVKDKYDPHCRIHNGRVFASAACKAYGFANIFAG